MVVVTVGGWWHSMVMVAQLGGGSGGGGGGVGMPTRAIGRLPDDYSLPVRWCWEAFSVRALELLRLAFRPSPPPPSNTPCEHMYTHVNTRPPSGITLEHCPFAQTNTNQKGCRPTAISCSCRTAGKTRLPAWRRTRRPAHAARPGRRRSPRVSIAALYRCCVTVVCSTWASSLPGVALLVRCLSASASVSPDRSFGPLVAGRG